ncbi:hypothetical protein BD626DRAFT_486216 [Schizophyllum amplum]|uniref:Membrane-associated proteins in eicosanoid and glutathione metabolism n=1 Tax=Schizophyllum amplum TaxID=97359 RepID=A0A550CM98_9AGAR|nr:hypothetical protein BD626DRAFT_486216 [Auriculariopsis ampla]
MPFTLVLPDGIQYVGLAFVSTIWLQIGQAVLVMSARKTAGIAYPRLYAEKAEEEASFLARKFNCTQRAHQNTLEQLPAIYTATVLSALKYPVFAASALGLWVIGRILYTSGYMTGEPQKRNTRGGFIGSLCTFALTCTGTYSIISLALAAA